ncbi:L-histidine N(alpha)-methyltransferase [Marixanthomonas spongiae]|uniref:L-histidine N(Alpha)-methyltransferase n=1 Tax=Marixanthomonas spongiae TaxID=2174845 RepID=A0A2U0I7S6_9FLAO|nr:L-histidine N(alpha)-methyltransferase [Marixanthomonas spongiae]PVW17163.1 L-histidine N(alpha)-methyltransferase [Marixanthomonas spongiae]
MTTKTHVKLDTSFKKEVYEGLTAFPKYLSSKYFYDKAGDKLFQDIMAMPEYYLTDCEYEILKTHTQPIAEYFRGNENGFDFIELGAGDGKKTKILLKYLSENKFNFIYKPIDISQNAIDSLYKKLKKELPNVEVDAEKGEYFEVLKRLKEYNSRKKVIMVLGSNIGNLLHPRAIDFLSKLKDTMQKGDMLFMGFDQKKDPQTILNAYNDNAGITAAFNKNILTRINRELDADFEVGKFKHWETYNPETGTAKSFLVATKKMEVTIKQFGLTIDFKPWETIHTEISQKYTDNVVNWLANEAGLKIETSFTDSKGYYKNYVFKRKNV